MQNLNGFNYDSCNNQDDAQDYDNALKKAVTVRMKAQRQLHYVIQVKQKQKKAIFNLAVK